jgi:outer membrane receptor protein involved in Fe transport
VVSGNVVDKDGEGVMSANVTLNKDSALISGVLTDENGNFSLPNVPFGKYKLTISFIGYKTETRRVEVSTENSNIHLKPITLSDNSQMLKEVEVLGIASQTKFDIDKKIYTVNQNALSVGVGADEILKNIPSVNVDNEGNISLRNDENVQVWINGKPSGLTAENRGQILEQLPAESVESIEVISNPSSKYNPEGTSGIINVVLRKDRKAGYYGAVSAGASYPWGFNAGGNINYSNKKFDTYLSLNYRNNRRNGGGWLNRSSFGEQDTTYLRQDNENESHNQGFFARAGVDYHINDKNTIGVSGFTMLGGNTRTTDYRYSLINQSYSQKTTSDGNQLGYNFSIDYEHIFDKNEHKLTASAGHSDFTFDSNTDYLTLRENASNERREDINRHSQEYWLQADYTLPIGEKSKLEAGYKSSWQPDRNILKRNSILNDDFTLNRQIHAVYANYKNTLKFIDLGYLLGVRGEATITDWKNIGEKGNSASYDFFPSIFLSKAFGKGNEVQLSLTRRINRPGRRELNPLRDTSDSTNIRYGNPDLKPAFALAYELIYIKTWTNHTLSASAYLRQTDNIIQPVSKFEDNMMQTTYKNIASRQNSGLELSLKDRFFRIMELTSTVNLYYSKLYGNTDEVRTNENFSWDARIIGNVLIQKGFSAQLTGNYQSASLLPQGKRLPVYSFDAGLKKTFAEKITLNLSVRDIFNSRKMRQEIFSDNFRQESEQYFNGRTVRLTVSYNFGNLKPKKKTQKQQEENSFDVEQAF